MQNEKSLRGGNNKKKGQKHQNKTGFKPLFNDNLIKRQQNAPLDHLCERCVEQIKWKLKFCKYKVIKDPHTCVKCNMKSIVKSYRHCCDLCSNKYKICAKCLQQKENLAPVKKNEKKGVDNALLKVMEEYLKTLRERSRRKIMRLIKDKLITFNQDKNQFEYIEEGTPVQDLQFKGLDGLDDDSLDFLDEDDGNENNEEQEEEEKSQDYSVQDQEIQKDNINKDKKEDSQVKNSDNLQQQTDQEEQKQNLAISETTKQMESMQIKESQQIDKQ
ncbi:hypothetical protein PPERSA_01156 [Pseudocohnilembus persalinus]|uniref:Uncharacterized protein n=1 Tax=Pseudocohnilembus persalinus TaxID=266149 RepID=A0A0V0QV37_PSEPJ|nr:hypothetical protein PPERSA_01156 [Pseudocohnilembus persalinus]|eukprot:KRX06078.1 hypothetical protein PPERSA_01156 [Pseudocohnilembus persalinus]